MKSCTRKKENACSGFFIFLTVAAVTTLTTVAAILTIKEGKRVKEENKLLEYEVW